MSNTITIVLEPLAGSGDGRLLQVRGGSDRFFEWRIGDTIRFEWPALPGAPTVLRAVVSFMPKAGVYHQTPVDDGNEHRNASSIALALDHGDHPLGGSFVSSVGGRWCFGVMLTTGGHTAVKWLDRWVLPDPETGDGNQSSPPP